MQPPNLETLYTNPEIQNLGQQANQAATTATNYASAASLLPMKLKQAIQEKLNYNKDIIEQQNKAMADYFAAPSQARSDYQNIWDPFEREKLVARATANAYAPYASLTDILGQRQGNINDIVQAGTGAFNSAVTAQQGQADQAQRSYQNALGLADKLASIRQWSYEQSKPKGGGAGSIDASGYLDTLFGNAGLPPEPQPHGKVPPIGTFSPRGQWILSNDGWVPVID